MFQRLIAALVGTANEREIKRLRARVKTINELEGQYASLSDQAIAEAYSGLKTRHSQGESLDDLLSEVFALVREASKRSLGMRHFDVQLIGGMVLHNSDIAEMPTGEGKTLVATLPVALNALVGKGVHVVTVNDYLANRDANWMRPLYAMLGLSVGCIVSNQPREERQIAYAADVAYATNNELGFDYLRDNMVLRMEERVQRELHFAIVDEVDSILIDEARTPLIISGAARDSSESYKTINGFIRRLTREEREGEEVTKAGDFVVDEGQNSVELTEQGHDLVESLLREHGMLEPGSDLYDSSNLTLMHYVNSALRAHYLFSRDVHYMVAGGQVVIVDEHTGRPMPGRRWSNGIHQAVEAKEGVNIQAESQTLASTTFQNYFRHYDKLAGMTGTADTEAYEFREIYGLNVVIIPPNKPSRRQDGEDLIYITKKEKLAAIVAQIKERREAGQPILVGTPSIHASEEVAAELTGNKIPFELLNAKQPEREALIIAQAGVAGTVTIATNMAGRGTDIVLGGNITARLEETQHETGRERLKVAWQEEHDRVIAAGGLHILGTERHESRRIDNQLRGRAGRQGDPGSTSFYLSLEDDLMRIFASDRIRAIMTRLRLPEGEAINHRMVTRAIERAQRKVETRNFDIRKQLLEYDDVANEQREVLYHMRLQVLELENNDELVTGFIRDAASQLAARFVPSGSMREQWKAGELTELLERQYAHEFDLAPWLEEQGQPDNLVDELARRFSEQHQRKREHLGDDSMHRLQREITLQVIDMNWVNHLRQLDILRSGVHLRGYAQKNPKQEYKREAFHLFQLLLERIREDTVKYLLRLQVRTQSEIEAMEAEHRRRAEAANAAHPQADNVTQASDARAQGGQPAAPATVKRDQPKIGRNAPCYCGSGKKFKHCHGALA